jgi:hypothetical protein
MYGNETSYTMSPTSQIQHHPPLSIEPEQRTSEQDAEHVQQGSHALVRRASLDLNLMCLMNNCNSEFIKLQQF